MLLLCICPYRSDCKVIPSAGSEQWAKEVPLETTSSSNNSTAMGEVVFDCSSRKVVALCPESTCVLLSICGPKWRHYYDVLRHRSENYYRWNVADEHCYEYPFMLLWVPIHVAVSTHSCCCEYPFMLLWVPIHVAVSTHSCCYEYPFMLLWVPIHVAVSTHSCCCEYPFMLLTVVFLGVISRRHEQIKRRKYL
jgi:hypothetical protein